MKGGLGEHLHKSFVVRIAGARCLKVFASIGGPCLGVGEIENSAHPHTCKHYVKHRYIAFKVEFNNL